ncbi:generative cell specific-1 [Haematococcus lacustris]|uniref:Generative cell specific-1 n=1 Tax=Haematococcus lacustris TaxID=44745 RepID=A0A6A0A4C3_HAELA|nr:generative cell specific-1 [Haematococcus lacustris]
MVASYPMQYLASFNFKPVEVVVRPSSRQCNAGDYESSPTCGWYYVDGQQIPSSQGFTCQCSTSQIFDATLGGSNERTRANLDCDFWSNPLDILTGRTPCSAHCLDFDPLWYSVLTLSPSVPLALSSSRLVSAKLLGDLATYTQLPAISNMVLLVPRPSGWSPDQILAGDRSQWLLLESSQFSMDGSQCDKVGTSFSAFRYQVDGCARAPQTCLGGQIKDLMAADALRISRGRVPLNLLTRYTYGANSTFRSFNGGPLSFALPVTSQSTSLLLLSVSADAVRLVTNSAPGAITGTLMCTFNSVGNCSHAVRSVEARSVALAGGASLSLAPPLDIYVEDQAADPQRHCWLYLYNSQVGAQQHLQHLQHLVGWQAKQTH